MNALLGFLRRKKTRVGTLSARNTPISLGTNSQLLSHGA
jgi:hypothetical protein